MRRINAADCAVEHGITLRSLSHLRDRFTVSSLLWDGAAMLVCLILLAASGFRLDGLPFTPDTRYSDAVTSHFPAAFYFHEALASGNGFPVWRETILAGEPFAANPLNKTTYPPQWLAALLPPLMHLNLLIVGHIAAAYIGMRLWTRSEGLRAEASAFAALGYAISPRLIAHTGAGHLDVLYALAWLPWLMWAVRVLFRSSRQLLSSGLRLGVLASLLILADVRVSLFGLFLASAYALSLTLRTKIRSAVVTAGAATALTVILTASLTVPLLMWMPYLSRSGLTPNEAGVFSMQPAQLIGLIFAPQTGNPETLTYVGLPILLLAMVALSAAPRRYLLWIFALAIALLYALGESTPFWRGLSQAAPALLWFRVPARAWFVAALILPFLAGHGLQMLMDRTSGRGGFSYLVGAVALLAGGVFTLGNASLPADMAVGLFAGGICCVLCMFRRAGRMTPRLFAVLILLINAVDLLHNAHQWTEWRPESEWLSSSQVELAETLKTLDPARIYSPTYTLEQQTAAVYDLRLFGGVDPFQLAPISAAIRDGGGIGDQGYSVIAPPLLGMNRDAVETANRDAVPRTSVLAQWGVSHVVSAYPLTSSGLEQVEQLPAGYIYAVSSPAPVKPVEGVPAWPSGITGLPDNEQVATMNDWTVRSAGLSALAFVIALALFGVAARRGW